MRAYEGTRVGKRRSRLMKAAADPGSGEGVVAVIRQASDLLRFGVSREWLAGHLLGEAST